MAASMSLWIAGRPRWASRSRKETRRTRPLNDELFDLKNGGQDLAGYRQQEKWANVLGHRICYVDEGKGRPLLFVHGLGGSITNWEPNIEYFKKNYRVIALDLPGFGESDKPDMVYSDEFFDRVIRAFLKELGIERVTLAGNSLGGVISIKIALDHPVIVESLILVDTAGTHRFSRVLRWMLWNISEKLLKKVLLFISRRLAPLRSLRRLVAGTCVDNEYTEKVLEEACTVGDRPDRDAFLHAFISAARQIMDINYLERLGEIRVPTLIVWGERDAGIKLKVAYRVNRRIPGSFLAVIKDAAHVPQVDQPDAFNEVVERFLACSRSGPTR